jgi:murein DD-endopeptidase MepM/ murein hydrolase activator NlpD
MAVTARERVSETAARGWAAPRRAVAVLVVALISMGAVVAPTASAAEAGGTSGTGRTQPAPAPAEARFAAPPVGNTFPVPAPHEVSFSDSWHACRDGCSRRHKGNDLMAAEGTPAVAVESGVIAKVTDKDVGKGGLSLWLRGDSGNAYYYAHNSANLVRVGQRVARGQVIARVGHTGNAATTPPHIHFQINRCGELSSDEPCTISPYELLRGWPQELVDGGADAIGWYTPVGSTFRLRTEGGSALPATRYGSPRGDVALAGDWNGDGRDTIGVYRTASNTFYLRDDAGKAGEPVRYGRSGDLPVVGDWNGDGRDTVGVYRPADATFRLRDERGRSLAPVRIGTPGQTGMVALAGDWDGDRRDTVALFRPADGTWLRLDGAGAALAPVRYGGPGDLPLAGDWDGDGRDGIGVYRPSSSTYHLKGFTDRRGPIDTGTTTARTATATATAAARRPAGTVAAASSTAGSTSDAPLPSVADRVSDAAARAAAAGTSAAADQAAGTTADGAGQTAAGGTAGAAAAKSGAAAAAVTAEAAPEPAADRDAVADPAATLAVVPVPDGPIVFGTPAVAGAVPLAGDWNGHDLVTIDDLHAIFGKAKDERAEKALVGSLPLLNESMVQAGAVTPARKAAFLATIHNESNFRPDAVEPGESEYRGRGYIQITGASNYRSAGAYLDLELEDDPALAASPLVSPAVASWYWTVARNINLAADRLDMAAVNIAVGYRPSVREDTERCGDFVKALKWFNGGTLPAGVNCERGRGSLLVALSTVLPFFGNAPTSTAAPSATASSTSGPSSSAGSSSTAGTGATTTRPPATRRPSTTTTSTTAPSTTRPPTTTTTTGPSPTTTTSTSTTTTTTTTTTTAPSDCTPSTSTTTTTAPPECTSTSTTTTTSPTSGSTPPP